MEEEYDCVVLGTGLKECIVSGLLSVAGKKVLHMDRNSYYGGESASLTLNQLWERFRPGQEVPTNMGRNVDYNVDLVPKFMMADGKLVKTLVHTGVEKYMEFKAVDGCYTLKGAKIHRVPATGMEAATSPLMGFFEKRRARSFLIFVEDYDPKNPQTWQGYDLSRMTMRELYAKFSLADDTIEFLGHSVALHVNDSYMDQTALATVLKMKLYNDSINRFPDTRSPFIYPLYGLGELPQAFARLSAVYGGTYMLSKPDAQPVFDESGKVVGVSSEGETAKCKFVVGDPSYFPGKVKKVAQVVRAICIMNHPIPGTNDAHSVQVILPQNQVGRTNDIYLFCCSYAHNVAGKGKWIASISTTVETNNPQMELKPGLDLLGPLEHAFAYVSDVYEPTTDGSQDGCYISKGYDATTHFESTVDDALAMYERITGAPLDLEGLALGREQ